MKFSDVVDQARALLQRTGKLTYRVLKREFALDDEALDDLKEQLIHAEEVAADKDGKMLVWEGTPSRQRPDSGEQTQAGEVVRAHPTLAAPSAEAERRQLTVMFCDLVGSTQLSAQLDLEELREVVRAYQQASTAVSERYAGRIAQHLGDGLLVYFGYPQAHEDDAQRAVRAALGIVEAIGRLSFPTIQLPRPLQVRLGIHTGLVVIGEIGSSEKREVLALGETPNIAARVQGTANPDEVLISAATYRLVEGLFACEERGQPALKGISTPLTLYRVVKEGEAHSRFEVVARKGLTPLIGREHEYGYLRERWQRVKEGAGQVVLVNGEPGIGKSRLVEALKETVEQEGARCRELRCSPYHQNSALYPVIDHLQRLLQFAPEETPQAKLGKLQRALSSYRFPQADTGPLFAALLSLPHPDGSPPLTLSPQKQKEKTHEVLIAWLCEEATQQAMTYAWEDLHWADPSTLELLTLLLGQVPTTRLLAVLTFRPDFTPPWGAHSYLSQLSLSRLGPPQVEVMVGKVTGGKALPREVVRQIASKTDGVPLFVEELTKMVVESDLVTEVDGHYELSGPLPPLAIPSTLQDSLMARLDRLATVREIAQIGATIGREFTYELLQAVFPLSEETLRQGLRQLVEAELVFQSGMPPQARYLFKHALVQETAYQSLLKSRRQQLHQRLAQVLVEQFGGAVETQPELVAHHYTEAGLVAQALPYWQRAGQSATQRSAHVEAIAHLSKGLELLNTLPDTPARAQQELTLQIALGAPLRATKGFGAPEVNNAYARARELCQLTGATSHLFPILRGLWEFYQLRAEHQTALELAEQLLALAQRQPDPSLLLLAHNVLADTLLYLGEFRRARDHLERGWALYDVHQYRAYAFLYGYDPGVHCLNYGAWALWCLGYPEQALKESQAALSLARELSHPFTFVTALHFAVILHHLRREAQLVRERAETEIALCTEQGFAFFLAGGSMYRGWALVEQGQEEEGLAQLHQGLGAWRATGTEMGRPRFLALLAAAYGKVGETKQGLAALVEALAQVEKTGERYSEAELYRLKGELLLAQEGKRQKAKGKSQKSEIPDPKSQSPNPLSEAAACFLKAIEVARKQGAKSLELRAATSLARLWQQQGKREEAHQLLAEVYGWFTEGFDTKDLQEAKALLEELP